MKCIAAIAVDLECSPLGTRSRLADELAGKPVLRRTLERVCRCQSIASIHLLCPLAQVERIRPFIEGLRVSIDSSNVGAPPYSSLVRAGRAWGLESWRGGIGSLTVFDEDLDVEAVHALAERENADAVIAIAAAAVMLDPHLIDALVSHFRSSADAARMTFVQAPPGLAAIVLGRDLLRDLAPTGQPPGVLMAYHPDRPVADLTGKEACYRPSAEVIQASGRLLADTESGFDRLAELIDAGGEAWDAARISRWLSARRSPGLGANDAEDDTCSSPKAVVEAVPTEIEIELTTEDGLPDTILRPRGPSVGPRGPIRQSVIDAIIEAIRDHDDVRIVLGGFGEPCLHPAFAAICQSLRGSTALAIAVRTTAICSPDERGRVETAESAIFETPVDAVEVMLDAATAGTYQRVHGIDAYEQALARVERWIHLRESRRQVRPLIVPSFIKARENLDDMEAFFDRWQRRLGTALITGYSHCAGQRPSRAVSELAPPQRSPCRRMLRRVIVLADGRMTTCDQDFAGRQAVGIIGPESFTSLWQSPMLDSVRFETVGTLPLCRTCGEWHRP